ncbi:MAG TPA: hypothetical protein VH054_20800 [Polyangiaceae bacterium]|jgi:hypothetical protein|nr:hypothetical protein [Polyangiaceae bacterium]
MKIIAALALVPCFAIFAACSAGDDGTGSSTDDLTGSTMVSRGEEWVNAKLHYCQAAYGAYDGDSSCWGWEGSSHRCYRHSDAAWNKYRSDCSGFVSYSWGLPAVGSGGYVTGDFAPFSSEISHTIDGGNLAPGDALNKTNNEHIILFSHWTTPGHDAVFLEEPGCSSSEPYAHSFTSHVVISGDKVYVDYEGAWFYSIRKNGQKAGGGGGGSNATTTADACSKGAGYCTETLQCDNGHWIVRQDDPHACTTVVNTSESCDKGGGFCTSTLQCEGGHWVPRVDDAASCTSGPGS